MVAQENVTLIICVCGLEEAKRPKCHKYWPDGDSKSDRNFEGLVSEMEIKTVSEESMSSSLTKRKFEIKKAD